MKTLNDFKAEFAINYLESNLFRFNLKDPHIWQYFTKNVDNDAVLYGLECAAKRYATYMCEQQAAKTLVVSLSEHFADNGEHSHYSIFSPQTGETIWSQSEEDKTVNESIAKAIDKLLSCLAPDSKNNQPPLPL